MLDDAPLNSGKPRPRTSRLLDFVFLELFSHAVDGVKLSAAGTAILWFDPGNGT